MKPYVRFSNRIILINISQVPIHHLARISVRMCSCILLFCKGIFPFNNKLACFFNLCAIFFTCQLLFDLNEAINFQCYCSNNNNECVCDFENFLLFRLCIPFFFVLTQLRQRINTSRLNEKWIKIWKFIHRFGIQDGWRMHQRRKKNIFFS